MVEFSRRIRLLPAWWCFAAFLSAPAPAGAVITFTPEDNVIFSSMVPQAVVPYSGGWRMYLTSGSYQILSATSTDQVTWGLESGVRLSTSDITYSSITSCGIYYSTNASDPLRMYYTAISSTGRYGIFSATGTDGLTWSTGAAAHFYINDGAGFLDSVRPLPIDNSTMRLFFTADNTGGNNSANYRIKSASSSDGGVSFTDEGERLSGEQAYQVSVATLTDGRTRLFYNQPLNAETTVTVVLSAISPNADGLSFTAESGTRLSTDSVTAGLLYPVVVRATDSWKWRIFHAYTPAASTGPYISSALAEQPLILTMNPTTILNSGDSLSFSLTGELFSPSPTVTFTIGSDTITATGLTVTDLGISGTLNPLGKQTGAWHAVVTNSDGQAGTLGSAFVMDIAEGSVTIVDNLFRPLKGGAAQISTEIFGSGHITIKLFSLDGGLITTLMDADQPAGSYTVRWNGRTSLGSTVASGVYLLVIQGPKINRVKKIVVIK